uniref:Uncharacterized protein n=1 Tax=Anguilla anguilla TaxID=7936 RepID=A0A0E9UVP3_ANGAN
MDGAGSLYISPILKQHTT